jgi:hypothetical protein
MPDVRERAINVHCLTSTYYWIIQSFTFAAFETIWIWKIRRTSSIAHGKISNLPMKLNIQHLKSPEFSQDVFNFSTFSDVFFQPCPQFFPMEVPFLSRISLFF